MDVTKRLMELDPTLKLHNEGHWDKPLDEIIVGYTSFNDAGVETEVGEFLYAMVRILKPSWILETGTHWGVSTCYMAQALEDNNKGLIDTYEFQKINSEISKKRFEKMDLNTRINLRTIDVAKENFNKYSYNKFQLILLDTEPQTRFAEMVRFVEYLDEGGFVFIHDLHRHMHQIPNEEHGFAWPFGEIPQQIKDWVKNDVLRPFHFPTPRGLTGFYKVHKEDYKWHS